MRTGNNCSECGKRKTVTFMATSQEQLQEGQQHFAEEYQWCECPKSGRELNYHYAGTLPESEMKYVSIVTGVRSETDNICEVKVDNDLLKFFCVPFPNQVNIESMAIRDGHLVLQVSYKDEMFLDYFQYSSDMFIFPAGPKSAVVEMRSVILADLSKFQKYRP